MEWEAYCREQAESVKQLIRELAVIPAPSGHEEKRAVFLKSWLEDRGAKGVFIDEAKNVIWPLQDNGTEPLTVFMAHTDVVFPDTDALPFREDSERFYCPGVGDDTACLAVLLHAALFFSSRKAQNGILICMNSCEEGLGNLKGCRAIVDTYGRRVRRLITVDGSLDHIVTRAVGSHRYRVRVHTAGGHSYGHFGNENAIVHLADVIRALYNIPVPEKPGTKTTYNVGVISGGTTVNSIASDAEMLYEYRSDDPDCLEAMRTAFEDTLTAYRAAGMSIDCELLGERPCGKCPDPEAEEELLRPIRAAARRILGEEPKETSGSTDANYPLSLGIPAVCIGGCTCTACHSREESLDIRSLAPGLRFVGEVLSHCFA